jgi:hypothetical protein
MKLYRISQSVNNDYDTYDSAVVAAETGEKARNTHPSGHGIVDWEKAVGLVRGKHKYYSGTWCWNIDDVQVEYIGEADKNVKAGVVVASYNAG